MSPCGNLLSSIKECRCSDLEIKRYKNRLSEPLLDRIDMYVIMNEMKREDKSSSDSKSLHTKVIKAFEVQKQKGQENLNGKLSDKEISKFCSLDKTCEDILHKAILTYQLSSRSINKVLKVARTIADLNENTSITSSDLMKSLSFRRRNSN